MADVRSPDSSGKTYFPDYRIKQGDPVRSAWIDMLKKNSDDVLYTGLTEPLAKAGYEDVGAALAAVPSAINEFVIPSELGAWVPMMGGIKKVTKLPTAAKEPVINPPQTNEVLNKATSFIIKPKKEDWGYTVTIADEHFEITKGGSGWNLSKRVKGSDWKTDHVDAYATKKEALEAIKRIMESK